jgi:hypothetical protein
MAEIEKWLASERVQTTIKVFTDEGSQIEGWFKGELMVVLSRLREESKVGGFKRECKSLANSQQKVDLQLSVCGKPPALVELKAGHLRGGAFGAKGYVLGWIRKGEYRGGVKSDIEKLSNASRDIDCYAILFAYPPPAGVQEQQWNAALTEIAAAHREWHYGEVTTDACVMAVWHRGAELTTLSV